MLRLTHPSQVFQPDPIIHNEILVEITRILPTVTSVWDLPANLLNLLLYSEQSLEQLRTLENLD